MNYNSSVSDFFKSPKWGMNAMLSAVALIIPLIGPIVLGGWHVTGFWARGDHDDPKDFPDMDFAFFTKYLERGIWPFLVSFVASLVLIPVILILMVPFIILLAASESGGGDASGIVYGLLFTGFICIQIALMLIYQIIALPLTLRATLTQDFKQSFNFGFVKDFLSRVWREVLATMVFMFGLGLCTMIIGLLTCYIGFFFAGPLFIFSWHHLQKQLYQLYLARGGKAVPMSPKLRDLPPPPPPIS